MEKQSIQVAGATVSVLVLLAVMLGTQPTGDTANNKTGISGSLYSALLPGNGYMERSILFPVEQ